nr:MAG TPA: hypothetical protein [Caudoviricetes sp.]DAT47925.1 MAG TPA: hypothetical protein [Caudoviricetes sp.]
MKNKKEDFHQTNLIRLSIILAILQIIKSLIDLIVKIF